MNANARTPRATRALILSRERQMPRQTWKDWAIQTYGWTAYAEATIYGTR